jgi:hypothetical protein
MWKIHGRGDTYPVFWLENLRERDHPENIRVDGRKILKRVLKNCLVRRGLDISGLG